MHPAVKLRLIIVDSPNAKHALLILPCAAGKAD